MLRQKSVNERLIIPVSASKLDTTLGPATSEDYSGRLKGWRCGCRAELIGIGSFELLPCTKPEHRGITADMR